MIGRLLVALLDLQEVWAKPLGDVLVRVLRALFKPLRPIKDFLHGRWLGHSLHAALTDLPIGALLLSLVFDLTNVRAAADTALAFGLLAMGAAAVAGLADYTDTDDRPRWVATVHATLMVTAEVLLVISLIVRLGDPAGDRTLAVALSALAFGIVGLSAWVGGEVVYALGNMVNRHAWRFFGEPKWAPLDVTEIPEGTLMPAKAGSASLVVVRRGNDVYALHDTCAHAGGPLSKGRLVDGCVECPWHASRFEMATGRRRRGPTTFDQPRYEVRAAEGGGWEARRVGEGTGQNL
jgi:nitrite reductase/ring-hydroxylating ferredoxin subunit/uncharacterized membrane protein